MAHGVNLLAMGQADLDQLWLDVRAEVSRRVTLDNAAARIREINQDVLNAAGLKAGDPWDSKMRTRGGYAKGWTVTHQGVRFESLIDNNVWEPGDKTDPQSYRWWKNLDATPAPGAWDGNDVAYKVGDVVTFGGSSYRALQAHLSQPGWTPTAAASLWEKLA